MLLPERVNITNEGCRVLNAAPLYFYVFKSPGWWGNLNLLGKPGNVGNRGKAEFVDRNGA